MGRGGERGGAKQRAAGGGGPSLTTCERRRPSVEKRSRRRRGHLESSGRGSLTGVLGCQYAVDGAGMAGPLFDGHGTLLAGCDRGGWGVVGAGWVVGGGKGGVEGGRQGGTEGVGGAPGGWPAAQASVRCEMENASAQMHGGREGRPCAAACGVSTPPSQRLIALLLLIPPSLVQTSRSACALPSPITSRARRTRWTGSREAASRGRGGSGGAPPPCLLIFSTFSRSCCNLHEYCNVHCAAAVRAVWDRLAVHGAAGRRRPPPPPSATTLLLALLAAP